MNASMYSPLSHPTDSARRCLGYNRVDLANWNFIRERQSNRQPCHKPRRRLALSVGCERGLYISSAGFRVGGCIALAIRFHHGADWRVCRGYTLLRLAILPGLGMSSRRISVKRGCRASLGPRIIGKYSWNQPRACALAEHWIESLGSGFAVMSRCTGSRVSWINEGGESGVLEAFHKNKHDIWIDNYQRSTGFLLTAKPSKRWFTVDGETFGRHCLWIWSVAAMERFTIGLAWWGTHVLFCCIKII